MPRTASASRPTRSSRRSRRGRSGIIINSPGNPTGALISEADLATVADEAARRGIWILIDLCYEKLIYDPVPHNLSAVLARDDARPRGALRLGVEGLRDDRLALRLDARRRQAVVAACNALQSHSTSNVCSITQKAVVAGLRGPQDCVTEMLNEYRAPPRSALRVAGGGAAHPHRQAGRRVLPVPGRLSDFLSPDGIRTTAELAQALLDDARVAVTPGEAFDAPGFLRISYATSMADLKRGTAKILEYLHAHEATSAPARA